MHKQITYKLTSVSGLIMHNGQLADPMNPFTREMKRISSKRKKTDEDYAALADVEWEGGLYINENHEPIIPGILFEAMFIAAAKSQRLGQAAKAGFIVDKDAVLQYDGPKTVDGLRNDRAFRYCCGVRVQSSRVMRTRPYFHKWSATVDALYLPEFFNENQITELMEYAGRCVGVCDFRPRFGRFEVSRA